VVWAIHARLLACPRFHFARKEALMGVLNADERREEVAEHDHFFAEVGLLDRRLEQGGAAGLARRRCGS